MVTREDSEGISINSYLDTEISKRLCKIIVPKKIIRKQKSILTACLSRDIFFRKPQINLINFEINMIFTQLSHVSIIPPYISMSIFNDDI